MRRRSAWTLLTALLCLTALGVSHADPDDGPRLLRAHEFGLNFGAGKLSKKIYAGLVVPQVRDAKIEFGAEVAEGQFGLCIDGKKPEGFGFVTIRREFRVPIEAAQHDGPAAQGGLDGYTAQVLIEASLAEVSTGNTFGMERDIFHPSGQLEDFVFAGFTPNFGINGLTAFANHNGTQVGSQIDLPNTESAGILFHQQADRISAYVRRASDTTWLPIVEIVAPQSETTHLGFGASRLQKKNTVYFRDFFAKGCVNGEFEQPILRDLTFVRRNVSCALDALDEDVPNFVVADPLLVEAFQRLTSIEAAINTNQAQFQPNTQVDAMLRSLDLAQSGVVSGHNFVLAQDADRARVPLLKSIPVINHIFASGAGFKIKKPKEKELLILVRPTNILRLDPA